MRLVVRLEVVGVGDDPLGADGMVPRNEQLGHGRVRNPSTDLLLPENASGIIRTAIDKLIREGLGVQHPTQLPAPLVRRAPLLLVHLEGLLRVRGEGRAAAAEPGKSAPLGVVRLGGLALGVVEGLVPGRDGVVGAPLKHRQLRCLGGDFRDRLNPGGPRPDDADAQPGEVDALVRPFAGVVGDAGEGIKARDIGPLGTRQTSDGEHDESTGDRLSAVRPHRPGQGLLVQLRTEHGGFEGVRITQREPVGDMVQVLHDLGLGGVLLAPVPLLLELLVEGVRVVEGLHVAACAGVAVPVPHAADVSGAVEAPHPVAQGAELVDGVEAGDACSDDEDVRVGGGGVLTQVRYLLGSVGVRRVPRPVTDGSLPLGGDGRSTSFPVSGKGPARAPICDSAARARPCPYRGAGNCATSHDAPARNRAIAPRV
ncbi:hypothetical protein SSPIM334S_08549 [Streptomyces spiroverticillatus]